MTRAVMVMILVSLSHSKAPFARLGLGLGRLGVCGLWGVWTGPMGAAIATAQDQARDEVALLYRY
eukprot:scaffold12694_cov32-Tisochrysis_lutea.AAC.1